MALATLGMENIGVYITRFQNTVAQYIVTFPIMDLCLAAERKSGLRLSSIWWEYPALDILEIMEREADRKSVVIGGWEREIKVGEAQGGGRI